MSQAGAQLRRSLNLAQAIALAITLVVGAGALILPGLAYTQVGSAAVYAWVADAVVVIPLLVIFSYLAGIMPSADGVTGSINVGLSGWMGFASKALMLSTFVIAPPAIAVTGARYFAEAVGGSLSEVIGVCILFGVAFSVNFAGVRISGTTQQVLALIVTAALASIGIAAMVLGNHQVGTGIAPVSHALDGVPAMGMVFFAFGGWELLSFMAEEFKNPKRDFPLAAAISFLVVVSLYVLVTLALQLTVPRNDPGLVQAPIAVLLASFAGEASGRIVAMLGFLIIVASLTSAVWAASRLVFATAREGMLPAVLRHVDSATGVPRAAVLLIAGLFCTVTLLNVTGLFSINMLYQLAGQSLFVIYGLCALSFVRIARRFPAKVFGIATLVPVVAVAVSFGYGTLYALTVMGLGIAWKAIHTRRRRRAQGTISG